MESHQSIFKSITQALVHITLRLEKLLINKLTFSKEINYQINPFFDSILKELNSTTIKVTNFSEIFGFDKQMLNLTLFSSNTKPISVLTPERLCAYLKSSPQNLKKTYTTQPIPNSKILSFISILQDEIEILKTTKNLFKQNETHLERLFEEIDFFNNRYIDCTSFAEFFNHYSSCEESQLKYSETGCISLIGLIKGYESPGEKLFLEDFLEFIEEENQDKVTTLNSESSEKPLDPEEMQLKYSKESKESINFDCILEKSEYSINPDDSLEYRTSSRRTNHKSSLDQQSIIPRKNDQSIDDEEMAVNLSISQSMSPRSARNRDFYGFGNNTSFYRTFQQETSRNNGRHELTTNGQKMILTLSHTFLDDLVLKDEKSNKKEFIRIEDEYEASEKFDKSSSIKSKEKSLKKESFEKSFKKAFFKEPLEKEQTSGSKEIPKANSNNIEKLTMSSNSLFKTYTFDQVSRLPSSPKEQNKLVYASSLTNNFESSLIRSHSRNLAYLSQIKLSDNSCPKIIENCESSVANRSKNLKRPCVSSKVSVFESKKVEFVFTMQSLVEEYCRWTSAVEELITKNEKFTFFSAFSVIDTEETNEVTFAEFKEFLKDSGIQKKPEKTEFFFSKFSVFKTQLKKEGENKENVSTQKHRETEMSELKISQFEEKVMRFSDFLRIFYLQQTIPFIKLCKKRTAVVKLKWDEKMKSSYLNLFRVAMDSFYEIENSIKDLRKSYCQMKEIYSEETFEKTFGREIMRFDEMQKILGQNSTAMLSEISKDEPYVDDEKLTRYLKMDLVRVSEE